MGDYEEMARRENDGGNHPEATDDFGTGGAMATAEDAEAAEARGVQKCNIYLLAEKVVAQAVAEHEMLSSKISKAACKCGGRINRKRVVSKYLRPHESAEHWEPQGKHGHDTFSTTAASYTKFPAAPRRARPFPTCLRLTSPVPIPDLAALARGSSPSVKTYPQSPRTRIQQLVPREGLRDTEN
ncbi:hypothetical protein EDB84DRAFT_1441883 [Lactarius hengduanensis]|nr:hypothetical protein EDB84DRAFT_1441883 [Lactarius hengduanensis]